jgi:hypothetical protein
MSGIIAERKREEKKREGKRKRDIMEEVGNDSLLAWKKFSKKQKCGVINHIQLEWNFNQDFISRLLLNSNFWENMPEEERDEILEQWDGDEVRFRESRSSDDEEEEEDSDEEEEEEEDSDEEDSG